MSLESLEALSDQWYLARYVGAPWSHREYQNLILRARKGHTAFSAIEHDNILLRFTLGDVRAGDVLVTMHEKLIMHCLVTPRIRKQPHLDAEELLQEGRIELLQWAKRFDPARGVAFATYIGKCILHATRAPNSGRGLVYVPEWLRRSTDEGRAVSAVTKMVWIHDAVDGKRERTFEDLLADDAPTPEDATIRDDDAAKASALISDALNMLTPTQREVIQRRAFDGQTLEDIGTKLCLSRERIRQIETEALAKMRSTLSKHAAALELLDPR